MLFYFLCRKCCYAVLSAKYFCVKDFGFLKSRLTFAARKNG